jgi:hypothetical protein
MFENFEVISTYSRAQAVEDGILIDVSTIAKEAGILFPVAITSALWHGYVVPSEYDVKTQGQSVEGRLWDTLYLFAIAVRGFRGNQLQYRVGYVVNGQLKTITIKSLVGPGDHMEPVITLMLPNED